MGKVIYSVASSLDGYNSDEQGSFSWAVPDEAVVAALTTDLAPVSTYLYGRRMYETMAVWETDPSAATWSPESARFAETWKRAEKIVFSSSLGRTWTERTRAGVPAGRMRTSSPRAAMPDHRVPVTTVPAPRIVKERSTWSRSGPRAPEPKTEAGVVQVGSNPLALGVHRGPLLLGPGFGQLDRDGGMVGESGGHVHCLVGEDGPPA